MLNLFNPMKPLVRSTATALICLAAMGLSRGIAHEMPMPSETSPETPHGMPHEHETLEISAGQPVPSVDLIIHPDDRQGWNLEVQVVNFQFAPEAVNQAGPATEGHAHLYVNGVKLTRLYSNWYYLESLPPGRHELTVSLNTNEHATLTHDGQPIQDVEILEVR